MDIEKREQLIADLSHLLAAVTQRSAEEWTDLICRRYSGWGANRQTLVEAVHLVSIIHPDWGVHVPLERLQALQRACEWVHSTLDRFANAELMVSLRQDEYERLGRDAKQWCESLRDEILWAMLTQERTRSPFAALTAQMNDRVELLNRHEERFRELVDAAQSRIVSAEATLAAEQFGEQATKDFNAMKLWGVATALVAAASATVLWLAFAPSVGPDQGRPVLSAADTLHAVQSLGSKAIFAGLASYSLIFCARNFAASRHNMIINQHRRNALLSYQMLMRGTADQRTLDVILQHAAHCIFSPQPTGIVKEQGGADSARSSIGISLTTPRGDQSA